ncbi:response regulator [Poseidonocella sp. HB161398]|uniref:response regulator n=1 Tax=Poseidonocella sp. HB161398 TaxID=2320855 RepID=UPI0011082B3E|nr:response regulator [Poseidonocella sp. HB161398]
MARILIADDDVPYLDVFCEGMQAMGHEAVAVTSAEQLLGQIAQSGFDIVFLDVVMPGGGAITLTHEVEKADPELPVVIITGRPELIESPILQQGLRNACARVRKTATLEQLDALVHRYARPAGEAAGEAG